MQSPGHCRGDGVCCPARGSHCVVLLRSARGPDWAQYYINFGQPGEKNAFFYKYGAELRLLRSLELERVALLQELGTASRLNTAREAVRTGRQSVWSATVLAEAQRGSQRSLLRNLRRGSSGRPDVHATLSAAVAAAKVEAKVAQLQREEEALRAELPDVVQKLILGYELRTYYFELLECARKLLIVCIPVFFSGVTQLIFGLMVCFVTFGGYMMYAPFVADDDDRVASLCQVQIFFALLASIALSYDSDTLAASRNMDALLCFITFVPLVLGIL